jgi:adenylate kinase
MEPVILLMGPPGSGKGTFSQYLKEHYGYKHLSAGNIVRREIELQTPLGKEIEEAMKRGDYVDTPAIDALLEKAIAEAVQEGGSLIFDGFLRTERDLDSMCRLVDLHKLKSRIFILHLETCDAVCKERILNRLVCPKCEHIYNLLTAPPLIFAICDLCSSNLEKRVNDSPDATDKRIREFRKESSISFPRAKQLFPNILHDTSQDICACEQFYDRLVSFCTHFLGTPDELVKEFHRTMIDSKEELSLKRVPTTSRCFSSRDAQAHRAPLADPQHLHQEESQRYTLRG